MKTRRGPARRGETRKPRHPITPFLERVEDRILMATFTVTNTSDIATAIAGDGSLRGEILAVNAATSNPNTINFTLPAGVQTIAPVAPLPTITQAATIIQGTTGLGTDGSTIPLVAISGSNANATGPGLVASAAGVQIRNLIIENFTGNGINLNGGTGVVAGCYIGVGPAGNVVAPNGGAGILIASPGNTIGDVTTNPNVISANVTGIIINGGNAASNTVVHSYIGTDLTGKVALGNKTSGIEVDTAKNTIGGAAATGPLGAGNLISGNVNGILDATAGANGTVIQGNYIGTDITGLVAIPNSLEGVNLVGVSNVLIGGIAAGTENVISGNLDNGILIQGSTATLDRIQGNLIGIGVNDLTKLGNGFDGVLLNGSNQDTVGGSLLGGNAPQYGNTIAYNGLNGVEVSGGLNDGILSNRIFGVTFGQGIAIPNSNAGVTPPILTSAQSGAGLTRITGTYAGQPNTNYTLQFFSNQVPNFTGAGDGENYLLGDLNIQTNSVGTATFTTTINSAVPVGYFLSATATQGILVTNNTSDFAFNVLVSQAVVSDLAVTTSLPATGPLLNQAYTYSVTVTNNGPDDASGVILTDTLPTNSIFLLSSAGTVSSGVLTDDIGALGSGASVVVTITVKPSAVGPITNIATVTSDDLDPVATNNTSTTTGNVISNADLSVTLTPAVTTTPVGSPLSFVLSVGNNGPSTATGVVVTVQFPLDFTNIVVMPDQGTYTIDSNNLVTITLGILPASTATLITLSGTPTITETALTVASIFMSDVFDPNTANNTAAASVVVSNAADLGVILNANPNSVLLGGELFYTATITNNGPSTASEPVLLDTLPAGLTYDPVNSTVTNGTLTFSGGVVTANLNPMFLGDSETVTIAVFPTVSGTISNTVTVGDPDEVNPIEIDPDLTNNTSTTVVQVSPADVSVVVDNPTDPLLIGNQAVYQLEVTNNGPASASNVTLTDMFSAGLVDIVSTSVGTAAGSGVTANLGTLASGQTIIVTIAVDPVASGTLVNSAIVTSDEFDPNPDNNTSSSSNLISPVDVAITQSASANPLLVNNELEYFLTVTNAGPATATNVRFADTIPDGVVFDEVLTGQGTVTVSGLNTLAGDLGSIAPGGTVTVAIFVTPTSTGTATNTAAVSSDDLDTNPANNVSTLGVSVINLPGSIQAASPIVAVAENAGAVTLTFVRTGGTQGTIAATYATQDYTALAGVNYVATSGVITFLDGQSTATITIAVLDDGIINGAHGFFVNLSNPTGGASIAGSGTTDVVVLNTDRDLVPPVVSGLLAIPNGNQIDGFAITFDKAMNPATAGLLSNYYVFLSNGGSLNSGTPVALAAAEYNAGNNTVILVPTTPLPSNRFYEIVVNGTVGAAVSDISGNVLSGSSGPGSNYIAYYGQGSKLTYNDSLGNAVTLNISGGGTLAVFRAANGDASVVQLYGIVPHKTKLTGSVKKLSKHASGHTNIGEILGFGQFGYVKSSLTTPSFYVGSAPVGSPSSNVGATSVSSTVKASSVSTPVSTVVSIPVATDVVSATSVVHKKATPKGPHHRAR